ncbi:hypothetical protein SAMN04488245_105262 [Alloyangia pacifica]|uniref:Uncharacterized protein n=1 Tax=Alloyangia pacifica TaxID=311180 RepID=A0A1I6T347_9RHOB|nr:hypothetical protein SAMN04488245_105262 [Alloyangia pacifica]SFS83704.1 hypothetical protein SAMN04488050_105262 [Alloyangia pacifica]
MQLMVRSRNRLAMAVRETSYIKLRGAMEQEDPAENTQLCQTLRHGTRGVVPIALTGDGDGDGGGGGCGFSLIPRPR